jgi:hypothetical protein
MSLTKVFGVVAPVAVVILLTVVFWTMMWKFVLEPNPLIREFFDLDLKKDSKLKHRSHSKQEKAI